MASDRTPGAKRAFSIDAPDQARLKIARTEIEAVLKKHDLAGVVVLHTPGMSEFFYDIRPSYSCLWIDEKVGMLRMKSLASDYGNNLDAQRLDQAASANMVEAFADNLGQAGGMFRMVREIVNEKFGAEHTPGAFVPDAMEGNKQ